MKKRGASDMDDGDDTLHVYKTVPFRQTGETVTLVLFEGQQYFVVDSLAAIVSPTRSIRKLVCDEQLNVVGPCNNAWEWLRVEGEWERVMHMDHAMTYAEYLAEAGLISEEMAGEVDEWAVDLHNNASPPPSPPVARVSLDEIIERRAAAKRQDRGDDKGKEEEIEWDGDEDSSSHTELEPMDEDEDDEDDRMDALIDLPPMVSFNDVERLTAVNLQMIKASVIMQQQLPRDHPRQLDLQVDMHNAYEVLTAMHPIVIVPGESQPIRLPDLPNTGIQVRVGQRVAALGYERHPTREEYQEIGTEAARLYRAAGIAGPWKVVGWRGAEREDRYYYTTQTQRFIDQAIETVMG